MAPFFPAPFFLAPFFPGDGATGKVVEINWRSVHIATFVDGLRINPNSQLFKGSFINLSRPTSIRTEVIELGFGYNDAPNCVKRMLLDLLAQTPGVLNEPPPAVRTVNYTDFATVCRVVFSVVDSEKLSVVRDDFMSRIWYAVKCEGISIPFPAATHVQVTQQELDAAAEVHPVDCLSKFPAFKTLLDPPRDEQIEAGLRLQDFGAGEVEVEEGSRIEGLHVITRGEAVLSVRGGDGLPLEVARVSRGEFFGEGSVVAALPSEVTVTSIEDLQLLVASPAVMYRLIGRTPALSRQLGSLMESRRKAVAAARRVNPAAASVAGNGAPATH